MLQPSLHLQRAFQQSFFRSPGMHVESRRLAKSAGRSSNIAVRLFVCFAFFASFYQLSNRILSLLELPPLHLAYPED
jgi:hypothetical protein